MQQAKEKHPILCLQVLFYGLKAPPKGQCSYAFFILANPDKSILSGLKALFHQVKNNTLATQTVMSYIASCYTLQKFQLLFVKPFFRVVRDWSGYYNNFIVRCL